MPAEKFEMPGAVPLDIYGIKAMYVDVEPGERPTDVAFTRVGELAPFKRVVLPRGCAIVLIDPGTADMLRKQLHDKIEAMRQAERAAGNVN